MRDGHAKLRGKLLAGLLRVVGAVEVVARDGALGARHVAADDEVRGPKVLTDDHVLDGLARPRHLHAVRQVGPAEHGELLLRLLAQGLIGPNAHDAVDVARLRGAASGVHQEDGVLHVALGALQQLEVCPVDGVAVLEGHDFLASRELLAHLCGRLHSVLEGRARDPVQPAAHVVLALLGDEGVDGGVLQAGGAVAFLGLHDLVRLEDGRGVHHSHVLAGPPKQDLVALLDAGDVRHVQGHRQAEELLLRQAHARHHGVVGGLVHEARERAEGAVHQAEHVASLAFIQLHRLHARGDEPLGLCRVLHHKVHEGTPVGCTSGGGPRVDAALGLRLAQEAPGALALVRLHGHGGVRVAEGLVYVGERRPALDLSLRGPPEGLAQIHLCPGQVRQVPLRPLDGRVAPEGVAVRTVHRNVVLVGVLDNVLP
mmetsp:Transcript_5713/g.18334  ORF Transcript_5713/g.18334 Transcript_5713/m.18334 type:complete len:427 (+) Transcript_5713:752-2032(+)